MCESHTNTPCAPDYKAAAVDDLRLPISSGILNAETTLARIYDSAAALRAL